MGTKATKVTVKEEEREETGRVEGEGKEEVERVEVRVGERVEGAVRLVLISDTHNKHRQLELPEGDVLIHAGDFTNRGTREEIQEFDAWLGELQFQHKVAMAV